MKNKIIIFFVVILLLLFTENIYNVVMSNQGELDNYENKVASANQANQQIKHRKGGVVYVFLSYSPKYVNKDVNYKVIGTNEIENTSDLKIEIKGYEQKKTVTKEASISENLKENVEIRSAFLETVEKKAEIVGAFSRTWKKGEKYMIHQIVEPNTKRVLTNYAVGVYSRGVLNFKKYENGVFAGYYTEPVEGTIISTSDCHIVVNDNEIKH